MTPKKVLDPPDPDTVEEALDFLVHIRALAQTFSHRARYEPTFYGRLLDSLPLSFDASVLALRFGEIGLLQHGILISILMDIQPLPILIKGSEPKTSQSLISELEEEWCSLHNIMQTSLHNIAEIYEDVIRELHRFRPAFLAANRLHIYHAPSAFKHTCTLQSELLHGMNGLKLDEENVTDEPPAMPPTFLECFSTLEQQVRDNNLMLRALCEWHVSHGHFDDLLLPPPSGNSP